MGNESTCRVEYAGQKAEAKTLLETEELIVRAPFRLKIPFNAMTSVSDRDGWLRFEWEGKPVAMQLGDDAPKWAAKIRNPKSRIEKLGVKAGQKVSIVGSLDPEFREELSASGATVGNRLSRESDVVFLAANDRETLGRLSSIRDALVPNGAVWVIRPKGVESISENDVMAAAKRSGLVDVKVVRFSAAHTAEKLVIPVTKR